MFRKGTKGNAKRIVAMLLAVLMVWSLVPANAYPVMAAETGYTITVTDENGAAITDATITVYEDEDALENGTALETQPQITPIEGVYSVTTEDTYWYSVEAEGKETKTGAFADATDGEISVILENEEVSAEFKVTGTITLPASVETPDFTEMELNISAADVAIQQVNVNKDGTYSFQAEEGKVYTITIESPLYHGTTTYTADDADPTVTSYQAILKQEIELSFEQTELELIIGKKYTNPLLTDLSAYNEKNCIITYATTDNSKVSVDSATGEITAVAVTGEGEAVTITVTVITDITLASTASYTVKVVDKKDAALSFDDNTVDKSTVNATFGSTFNAPIVVLPEALAGALVTYTSSDDTVARVEAYSGKVTILKAGTTTITASFAGNDEYKEASISYDLNVAMATQDTFEWDTETLPTEDVIYEENERLTFGAVGNVEDSTITYAIKEGSATDVVSVDAQTGEITILKAGTVIITATASEVADKYTAKTIEYELTVNKADQADFYFRDSEDSEIAGPITIINGDLSFNLPTVYGGTGDGDVTYSVNEDNGVATINSATGELTFTYATGTVTITATKAADECYEEAKASYILVVNPWEAITENTLKDTYFAISLPTGDNGWYIGNDNIVITAKEGYKLSTEAPNPAEPEKWVQEITLTDLTEGTNNVSLYIKNTETGYISELYAAIETVKLDTNAPVLEIKEKRSNTVWEMVVQAISGILAYFGVIEEQAPVFEITASDETSGMTGGELFYYFSEGTTVETDKAKLDKFDWTVYEHEVEFPEEGEYVLYAKAVDEAGNESYHSTNGMVYDATKPVISDPVVQPITGAVVQGASSYEENGMMYYKTDVAIGVSVFDALSGVKEFKYQVTYGNEVQEEKSLNITDENQSITIEAKENSDELVKVIFTATDKAGNVATKEISFYICTKQPTVSITLNGGLPDISNIRYFKEDQVVAEVVIDGFADIFNEDGITVKDADNQPITQEVTWHPVDGEPNKHKASIVFEEGASYSLQVIYKDKLDKSASANAGTFVVDNTKPSASIDVGDSWYNIFFEAITFGLWENPQNTIEITSAEDVSGIKSVHYYLQPMNFADGIDNLPKPADIPEDEWVAYAGAVAVDKTGAYICYIKVEDNAGNTSYENANGFINDQENPGVITLTPNKENPYNTEAVIGVKVEDNLSGIKEITYWLGDDEAKAKTLYEFTAEPGEDKGYRYTEELKIAYTTEDAPIRIPVQADGEVTVHVKVIDNAGNVNHAECDIMFDTTAPVITVSYDNNASNNALNDLDGIGYFANKRTATIKIVEENLNQDDVNIIVRKNGTPIDATGMMKTGQNDNEYTYTIAFSEEARYNLEVSCTDLAGNTNAGVTYEEGTVAPKNFVYDTTAPTGKVTVGQTFWDTLLSVLTLGLWSNENVTVSADTADSGSGVEKIEYFMVTGQNALVPLEEKDLKSAEWNDFSTFTVNKDETFVVYLKITDYAGNYTYVCSNGYTVDKSNSAIVIDELTDANEKGYYKDDIELTLTVKDILENTDSYSGIKQVTYWVTNGDTETLRKVFTYPISDKNANEYIDFEDVVSEMEYDIIIDAENNNSDNVKLYVEVVDNAGNVVEEEREYKIDISKPTISLLYNNGGEILASPIENIGYFKSERQATIVITERASGFDALRATNSIIITATDINGEPIGDAYTISNWTSNTNANPDETTHTATINFTKNAYYTVSVGYVDNAGNANTGVDTGSSLYPYEFAVDASAANVGLYPTVDKNIYNSDVDLKLTVNDSIASTGINSIKYWISAPNNVVPEERVVYQYDGTDKIESGEFEFSIPSELYNFRGVEVKVEVIDNAGNTTIKTITLNIDITAPVIDIEYDNNNSNKLVDNIGYFNEERKATITVKKRSEYFDAEAFLNSIEITAKNVAGGDVAGSYEISEITTGDDGLEHTCTITYRGNANYTFAINYTDAAGNVAIIEYKDDTVAPNRFTVDKDKSTATITVGKWSPWETLLNVITFGLWSPSAVDVVIESADKTSPIESVKYYKTSTFTALSESDLAALDSSKWTTYQKFTVSSDDIFVVYARVEDYAGHVTYVGTNGIIVDKTKPVFETLAPEVTITPEQPVNGIYNGNVRVDVSVSDPKDASTNAYAGIREIRYEVYNMGQKTQDGILYRFDKDAPTQSELLQYWSTSNSTNVGYGKDIVVDASLNNSNDVTIKVIANDNSGNESSKEVDIKIDTTRPTIDISYDNNDGDVTFADSTYFAANRVATIVITERNFDANKVDILINNTESARPVISEWRTVAGTGNGDNATHTATVTYAADGDYTFDISYDDNAGNANAEVDYGNTLAPTEFTIDKTLPVINVSYDNNDAANGNYYKADRVATITITEHNFDVSRLTVTITASDDGQVITAPVVSTWSTSGDTHTATVSYNTDALYTFDIAYTDKAGNIAEEFAEQSFYVDKTAPSVTISGIANQSANNAAQIGFTITATDTNFDVFDPVLSAVVKTDNGFTTEEISVGSVSNINNGKVYTVNNIDADGIYRITCTVVDKAGNAYTAVTLEDVNGDAYTENLTSADTLVNFSVNRDGSTYEVDENTSEIVENFYVYEVTDKIIITEINTDTLASYKITLNGKELVEGTDYTVETEGGNGAWMKYRYALNSELFMAEGEYVIVVSSKDKAENNAFSDVKDTKVAFVVDRTAPVITLTGMQDGGRYQADNGHVVTLIPTDDGGTLSSLLVRLINADGEQIGDPLFSSSGEELLTYLDENDGTVTFTIPTNDGGSQLVEVLCYDSAKNADGEANVYTQTFTVIVASSELALVWATPAYRYSIIGGSAAAVILLIGLTVFLVKRKAKKDKTIIRK